MSRGPTSNLLDPLLAQGADLNARTSWENGGFGMLEQVNPEQAAPLIARGARIDIWARPIST